ncbi:unnamed protein product [Mycena citricolor]|uniref:Uncharacterized protein n=1 Tax=Mycena citricolor TaxID=2018698 RepID=A0AAD2GT28_9AGAR|nr:unnamed protein product [Mycena citricolor]
MRGRVYCREYGIESTGAILGLTIQMAQSIKVDDSSCLFGRLFSPNAYRL